MPSFEEMKAVNACPALDDDLSKPDRFIRELSRVPQVGVLLIKYFEIFIR